MPFLKQAQRAVCLEQGLEEYTKWMKTIPVELRKGFVAFSVEYLARYAFTDNYFGKSTGTDAIRSAYVEMDKDLDEYEDEKKDLNGDV